MVIEIFPEKHRQSAAPTNLADELATPPGSCCAHARDPTSERLLYLDADLLPQLAAVGAATTIGIAATLLGNTLVGIVCGWLFWQRGLIAAIVAHFLKMPPEGVD